MSTLMDVCEAIIDCEHKTAPVGDGYAFSVGTKAMKNGRLVIEECKPVSKSTYEAWTRRMIPQYGDLILAREAPVGDVIRVPQAPPLVCLGQRTVLIRPDRRKVHPRFLHYWLLSPGTQNEMLSRGAGATVAHLNVEDIRALTIAGMPRDIGFQERAAGLLGDLDDLIENNRRRIELLDQMVQAIYREWFAYFRYPGHEHDRTVESSLGPLPATWSAGKLDDLLVLQRGFDLPAAERADGDIPVMAASGRHGFHNKSKACGPGVVTGRSGTVGVVSYVHENYWPLNTTLWVKEFKRSSPQTAYFLLADLGLEQYASGAAVPTLNRNHIHGLPLPVPPQRLITEFDEMSLPAMQLQRTLTQECERLARARDLLLSRLVTGEIDVPRLDPDAMLEGAFGESGAVLRG